MGNTQATMEDNTGTPIAATTDQKLEVIAIPVSDVDRAKSFYQCLGWRVDGDFGRGDDWRLVQMTPPGSPCSVMFGSGFTTGVPGSAQGTLLVVDDLDAARTQLIERGIDVSGVFHFQGGRLNARSNGHEAGRDPQGRSYYSFASFADPDGNTWLLQEVTTRIPGRGFSSDVATLTALLRETEERHGGYEASAPKHHWSEWYAAYIVARVRGRSSDDAAADAALNVERSRARVPA